MVFAHGFGCDKAMWRFVAPEFEPSHKVVLFDHVGAGGSDLNAYDPVKYRTLDGYADDIIDVITALELPPVVFVGHSVSAMIGVLAALKRPDLFESMVMVGPSPRYIDDGDYRGGFSEEEIHELLETMDANYLGWSAATAPVIMGVPEQPELGEELTRSFCAADPDIARQFAKATFLSDNRADLDQLKTPSLVVQCKQDVIAPISVGEFVRDHLENSEMVVLDATGHCPNLSAPDQLTAAMKDFLAAA